MSDFSLMDAIECGIVKLPRVPVAENIPGDDMPMFRNLWENIRKDMPRKGRGKKTFRLWQEAGISVPPCFIIVCNNTSTSKLVYDFVSGFHRQNSDGSSTLENGRLPLFKNFDEHGNPLPRPSTLLIDSEQLESGEALEDDFRVMAADEIERFRREIVERTGDRRAAESLSDQDLLREDSTLVLTPDLVGPSITRNQGIIGEGVDLSLEHLGDVRPSTVLFHLTQHLLYKKWRDAGEAPKLHLFGQLKRITREWLDKHLVCTGGTKPAQLLYQELAEMACNRITAAITSAFAGSRPIKAVLDPYNPIGSTAHVRFNTSRTLRWRTDPARCHVNWVVLDSDWEAELCRVVESHPRVKAYVKNENLGLEVPYRYGSEVRQYVPDFIVLVDDGHGVDDPIHLVVEIKGYRREDAKEKKATMDTYWVPGVNNLGTFGRWAFAELTEIYRIESDFRAKVASAFDEMVARVSGAAPAFSA